MRHWQRHRQRHRQQTPFNLYLKPLRLNQQCNKKNYGSGKNQSVQLKPDHVHGTIAGHGPGKLHTTANPGPDACKRRRGPRCDAWRARQSHRCRQFQANARFQLKYGLRDLNGDGYAKPARVGSADLYKFRCGLY